MDLPEKSKALRGGAFLIAAEDADAPVLELSRLRKAYRRSGASDCVAVNDVSLSVRAGECVGLVGESGSGKTTVARLALRLDDADAGNILLHGRDVTHWRGARLKPFYQSVQAIFQDPVGSFDPRRTLGASVSEGLRNAGVARDEAFRRALDIMESCGLATGIADRYPREVSGGQCQRAAIARALTLDPEVLVCDEATSALDATAQKRVIELLGRLRCERGLGVLFVCHDIALVSKVCDRVVVLDSGHVVEEGPTDRVLRNPQSDAARALLLALA